MTMPVYPADRTARLILDPGNAFKRKGLPGLPRETGKSELEERVQEPSQSPFLQATQRCEHSNDRHQHVRPQNDRTSAHRFLQRLPQ
jgi:hypothetical protein